MRGCIPLTTPRSERGLEVAEEESWPLRSGWAGVKEEGLALKMPGLGV